MSSMHSFLLFLFSCLLFANSCSPVFARSLKREPSFILRDQIWNLNRFGSYTSYIKLLKDQGYTQADLDILDGEGNFYFNSRALEAADVWGVTMNLAVRADRA